MNADHCRLLDLLAKGRYDDVINEIQKALTANAAWWESSNLDEFGEVKDNPELLGEYVRLLAIAYEL